MIGVVQGAFHVISLAALPKKNDVMAQSGVEPAEAVELASGKHPEPP
jgi:hypothetical protein